MRQPSLPAVVVKLASALGDLLLAPRLCAPWPMFGEPKPLRPPAAPPLSD